jgi:hypothetical protein
MKKNINFIVFLTLIFCFIIKSSYFFTTIQNLLEEKFQNLAHKNDVATVVNKNLVTTSLITKNRKKVIEKEFKKQFYLDKQKINVPKITVCLSGGGYRAMINTLGVLKGLEDTKLLPLVENIYSLSGSTWLVNLWLNSKYNLNKLETHLKAKLNSNIKFKIDKINKLASIPLDKQQYKDLLKYIAIFWQQKIAYGQRINIIDIWGLLIGLNIFPTDLNICQECLSNQEAILKDGHKPISISTAISPILINEQGETENYPSKNLYRWLMFSASQVSIEHENILYTIPSWAFGRKFKDGKSVQNYKGQSPELPLAYLLGIFGSAFSGSPQEYLKIINKMLLFKDLPIIAKTMEIATQIGFKDRRVAPAKIYNFIEHLEKSQNNQITVIDAGLECNIPLYPILKYDNSEIILIFDASIENRDLENFNKIILKALPDAQTKLVTKKNYLVLHVDGKIIFYLPLDKFADIDYPKECNIFTKNELVNGFGKITNFNYEENQFNAISKLAYTNIVKYESNLRKLILDYINL